ncbi:MAG: hypothetical protein ACRDKA_01965, partial [Actinomycetota bacterium]
TNLEILESRLDAETVRTITRLLRHLARRSKRLRPQLESLAKAVAGYEGKSLRQVLRTRSDRPERRKQRRPRR